MRPNIRRKFQCATIIRKYYANIVLFPGRLFGLKRISCEPGWLACLWIKHAIANRHVHFRCKFNLCARSLTLTITICATVTVHMVGDKTVGGEGWTQKAQQTAHATGGGLSGVSTAGSFCLRIWKGALKGRVMDGDVRRQHYLYALEPTNARVRPKSRGR